jgi:hypothetical protein
MSMAAAAFDPVETQLAAYNARDIETFLSCYTDDCVVDDGEGNRLLAGLGQLRTRYETLFADSPKLHADVVHRTRIGRYVLDEEVISGRVPDLRRAIAIYRIDTASGLIEHVRFLRED